MRLKKGMLALLAFVFALSLPSHPVFANTYVASDTQDSIQNFNGSGADQYQWSWNLPVYNSNIQTVTGISIEYWVSDNSNNSINSAWLDDFESDSPMSPVSGPTFSVSPNTTGHETITATAFDIPTIVSWWRANSGGQNVMAPWKTTLHGATVNGHWIAHTITFTTFP